MSTSENAPIDPECPTPGPFFKDLREKSDDPELILRRYQFLELLRRVRNIGLGAVEKTLSDSVTDDLPGFFGDYLVKLFGRSFRYSSYLRNLIGSYVKRFPPLVDDWHRFLDQAVTACESCVKNAEKHNLIAFNVVVDSTITLIQMNLDTLVGEVAMESGETSDSVRLKAQMRAANGTNGNGGKLEYEAVDVIDVLALVILAMQGVGPKPVVKNSALQAWLIGYFQNPKHGNAELTFGGAAGNETHILRNLGFLVLLQTPYHDKVQAAIAPRCAMRLVFTHGGPPKPFPSINDGDSGVPRKYSFVFQVTPERDPNGVLVGPKLEIRPGETILPRKAERVIFQFPNPKLAGTRWECLEVRWENQLVEIPRNDIKDEKGKALFPDSFPDEWAWFPVFQFPPTIDPNGNILHMRVVSPGEVANLAGDVQAILLGGLQRLAENLQPKDLRDMLRTAIVEQLRALKIPKHYELSGVSSSSTLNELKRLLSQAGVCHIGINRDELIKITSQHDSDYYAWPASVISEEDAFIVYKRAERFISEFACQSLYVHDLELDLLLIRSGSGEDTPTVAELERHRQAMLLAKIAVPLTLLRRAGMQGRAEWDFVLSGASLLSLVPFAEQYSRTTDNPEVALDSLLTKGYWRIPGGISVVVVPTIHVDLPESVSLAGAGDMCFAVRAAAISDPNFK